MTWCHVPLRACPFALEAVASTWALSLRSRDIKPLAMSNGRNTHGAFSQPRRVLDIPPPRPFGMTSKPSTRARGGTWLTPLPQATHASHLAKLASDGARMTSDTYGHTSPGSSSNVNLDGSFLKTLPVTSPLAARPCCEPYGTWATRLRLAYSQRVKLALRTSGSGGSAWPTARASESENRTTQSAPSHGVTHGAVLAGVACDLMKDWTTPQAHDVTMRGAGQVPNAKAGNACLARDALNWATPTGLSPAKNGNSAAGNSDGIRKIIEQAKQGGIWPTPAAHEPRLGVQIRSPGAKGSQISLSTIAHVFTHPPHPTPTHGALSSDQRRIARQLFQGAISKPPRSVSRPYCPPMRQVARNPVRAKWLARASHHRWSEKRRKWWEGAKLSPVFVEWLMGWPYGHALSNCSETGFIHWQRQMRGALCRLPMASGPWIWKPPAKAAPPPEQLSLI